MARELKNTLRPKSQVLLDAAAVIQDNSSDIAIGPGEGIRDVTLDAPSTEFERAYVLQEYVRRSSSIDGIETLLDDTDFLAEVASAFGINPATGTAYTSDEIIEKLGEQLDGYAAKVGLTRTPAAAATVQLSFFATSAAALTIALNSSVRTRGSSAIEFQTTAAITSAIPTFNDSKSLFEIKVPSEATATGARTNVGAGLITVINPVISGIVSVTNTKAAQGGKDIETNAALIIRIRTKERGKGLGTQDGLRAEALTLLPEIRDALAVSKPNTLMLRETAGATDLYIIDDGSTVTKTENISYVSGQTEVILTHLPVESITSVSGTTDGVLTTSQYTFVPDTGTLAKSVRANDKITFSPALFNTQTLIVVYEVRDRIKTLQDSFAAPGNRVVWLDLLVKLGSETAISITADVTVVNGYDSTAVFAAVESDLAIFFTGGTTSQSVVYTAPGLGTDIQKSDVIEVMVDVEGVDAVDLDTLTITRPSGPGTDPIVLTDIEYAILGTVVLTEV